MNLTVLTATQAVNEALTLSEKGTVSAKVVLTGVVVVFLMLLLLIFIIQIYGGIVSKFTKIAENKKEKAVKTEESVVVSKPTPAVPANGIPDEVVAVISAAVASMYGSTAKVKIKSIKKSSATRTPWANAGVLNNTRPF